ncbi:carbohydrate-binding protein [Dactylosporangium sp. CA-139114]|uniref:carbohydrate-binding protein n=1 Tax=Dactylosporangium sp. CA-139114 TaxID=3239931 RepID=UPI003D991D20
MLASLDESSYSGGTMGGHHPITWCKTIDSGRSFTTGFGHTEESYTDPAFTSLLLGAIRYTARRVDGDCSVSGATQGESYAGTGGVRIAAYAPAAGGRTAEYIDNGDWVAYPATLSAARGVTVRVASAGAGGTIEFRAGSPTGPLLGTVRVASAGAGGTIEFRAGSPTGPLLGTVSAANAGGWDTFREAAVPLAVSASQVLYVVCHGGSGSLFDIDEFALIG